MRKRNSKFNSLISDDILKGKIFSPNKTRCQEAYLASHKDVQGLHKHLSQYYLMPSRDKIIQCENEINKIISEDDINVVIPMREHGSIIGQILNTLSNYINPKFIVVVDNGSDDSALNSVRAHNEINLIHQDQILSAIDWPRLLPILNLKKIPCGKGVAVLAGYLFHYYRSMDRKITPKWIFQSDADIKNYKDYKCLQYLLYGIWQHPNTQYVKIAKFGRTNERVMCTRSLLHRLSQCEILPNEIRQRALEMFMHLTPHKWMQTGEFFLNFELAMKRPLATGYLDETVISLYTEDKLKNGIKHTTHVANPNPRLDEPNDERKESIMQQQISNWIIDMLLHLISIDQISLRQIKALNKGFMSDPIIVAWIPPHHGPVAAEAVENDRIIPSITQLVSEGFVDTKKIMKLVNPSR